MSVVDRSLDTLSMRKKEKKTSNTMRHSRSSSASNAQLLDDEDFRPKTAFDFLTRLGQNERHLTRSASAETTRSTLRKLRKSEGGKSLSVGNSMEEFPHFHDDSLNLPELSNSIWRKIFSHLSIKDLANGVGKTSKEWRSMAYSPEFWKKINLNLLRGEAEVNYGDVAIINLLYRIGTGGSILEENHLLQKIHPNDPSVYCYLPLPSVTPYKPVGSITTKTLRNARNQDYVNEFEIAIAKNDSRFFQTMEIPKYFDEERTGMCNSVESITFSYSWPASSLAIYAIGILCRNLKEINFGTFFQLVGPKSMSYMFSKCLGLEKISMRSPQSPIDESVLASMAQHLGDSLKHLEICRFKGHSHISSLRSLIHLDLEGANDFTDISFSALQYLRNLETLILNSTGVTTRSIEHLRNWFPLLRRLELKRLEMNDESTRFLTNGSLYLLNNLEMNGSEISDSSAFHIASGTFAKTIKRLNLKDTQIGEKGTAKIYQNCENLEEFII